MAHLYKKVKKGRAYYYIRETQRVYGKPATVNQVYLGTADKVEAVLAGEKIHEGLCPKEFGSVFVLNELERTINLASMVDEVLPAKRRSRGPSLGDLMFYAIMNRAIAPKSKRKMAAWYETTDIQRIHPGRLESLSSQNFWNHWDRLDEPHLERIVESFFKKVHSLLPSQEKHLVVETANFYASPGPGASEGGGAKQTGGRPLRRIGLALITERQSGVPVYYQTFPGDLAEGGFFEQYLDGLLAKVAALGVPVQDLTLLFNRGIDSPEFVARLEDRQELHFVAAYPAAVDAELARTPGKSFHPLPCKANRKLIAAGAGDEQILYFETIRTYWGRPRKVVVLFDPRSFPKHYQELQEKIKKVRRGLLELQKRYHQGDPADNDPQVIQARYAQQCQEADLSPALFKLAPDGGELAFQLQPQELEKLVRQFAKTILISDHEDWAGPEICQAYLDRCIMEAHIQDRHNPFQVALMPQYHWTDSKIRIHVFVCVAALTYLALLGHRLTEAGLVATPKEAMAELRALRSAIYWLPQEGKFKRILSSPSQTQLAILGALGYRVQDGKVRQIEKN
jgi:transposase